MFDIMIVDDTVNNLKVLSEILRNLGYKLRMIPSGTLALKAIELKRPDLILLDIMMPNINGYDLCKQLKQNSDTKDIPIIFISALSETENIVESFKVGGVDYITKPFKYEEVIARVDTQIEIIKVNKKNRELLSKTFTGSLQIITDILSTLKPEVYQNTIYLRKLVKEMVDTIGIKDSWVYEIASLISRIGYITLPDAQLKSYMSGNIDSISTDEHNESINFAKALIHHIPNLEVICSIFDHWDTPPPLIFFNSSLAEAEINVLGPNLLKLILEYNEHSSKKLSNLQAFEQLKKDLYHQELLDTLESIIFDNVNSEEMQIKFSEAEVGMVLSRDLITIDEVVLLSHDTEITSYLLSLLKRFEKTKNVKEPIYIWKS